MVTRVAIATALALTLVSGRGAARTVAITTRAGLVSLDLRTHREHVFPAADLDSLSPEGRRIAFAENPDNKDCRLGVRRLDGSHERVLVRTPFPVCMGEPRWSPDGRTIAYLRFDPACATGPPACHGAVQLWLVRPATGRPRLLSDDADAPAWGPDSRRLAFPTEVDGAAGLARLTVSSADGSVRATFEPTRSIDSLSWSPDGSTLFYSTNSTSFPQFGDGDIHAVDPETGRDRVVGAGIDPRSSADGTLLSFTHLGGKRGADIDGRRASLVVLHDGKRHVVLSRRHFSYLFANAWSRHGHLLACATTNSYGQSRIVLYDPDRPKRLRAVTGWTYGPVTSIAWSRDGRRLLFVRTGG